MFKNLTKFDYKRKGFEEAFGFYFSYFIATLLLCVLAVIIMSLVIGDAYNADDAANTALIVSILISVVLSLFILYKKKILNSFGYLLLAIVSGILAYLGGGILGLLIPVYLSTI